MQSQLTGLEVAVIGMSGRFPGSKNIEDFWQNLVNGVELTSVFADAAPNQTIKAGAVLEDIELFDAEFFGYNPREAETMDPQHRMFLECAWSALENAGYNCETETRPIGVYAGVGMSTYLLYNLSPHRELIESRGFLSTLIGVDKDYLPTRVSYKLNLTGPSVSVGTACSSSLVAVHLACQSLLSGECDMSLAAGVAVKVPQNEVTFSPREIAAVDGHCRAFDAKASGTVGGNGIGVVVLKRLEDAIADRDRIYAVIKGSAINNDGAMKIGYTAPSEVGQTKAIKAAQIMAEVEPETITYLETHGTGTPLGDPIEVAAMTEAFRASNSKKGYCAIGSVKTNVGHLDAAAGITSLIKTVLALDRQLLPPSLNFESPNPEIDFANSPFYINTKLTEWKTNGIPRRAGVSSFGMGGTNAHVILEEAPLDHLTVNSKQLTDSKNHLLVLSAKTSSALESATDNLVNYLQQHPEANLADVAYTLQVGRQSFNHRRLVLATDIKDALQALKSEPQRVLTSFTEVRERSVVFMFPGQESQYINIARSLYHTEATFARQLDICCELLQPQLQLDLRSLLCCQTAEESIAAQLQQTAITQAALFVIEYALAKLWISWGVHPVAMIGHSIGEYVAACLSGVFSLEDALALVTARGQLMQQLPSGSMLAVSLSELEVQPILDSFRERVAQVSLKSPQIPYISNVTGTWITIQEATSPEYWANQLTNTVGFEPGLQELLQNPRQVLLEVGSGQTLSKLAQQHQSKQPGQLVLSSLCHPKQQSALELLKTVGQLWLAGVEISWSGFHAHEQRSRIALPTYPFERQKYWIEPPPELANNQRISLEKKFDIADWFYIPSWKRSIASIYQSRNTQVKSKKILVFIDECNLGWQLVERLKQQNHDVTIIKAGSEFTQLNNEVYTLNPQQHDDYNILLKELAAQQKIPQTIVHLWCVAPVTKTKLEIEKIDQAQELGFYSLLFLAQALGKQNLSDELQIAVISNNLQSVLGDEILAPEKATLLGPVKVITQEYPNIICRSIDIPLDSVRNWQQEKLIDQLLTEIIVTQPEQIVAYRGNNRWVQTFEAVKLDQALEETPCFRQEGVYLVTGGLGGIGLVLAEHLAKTVQAKLILTSRSALPHREEWSHWLATHDEQDSLSRKLRQVIELEKLGAEVLLVNADTANLEQMQLVIAQVKSRFGAINGVIHAAGLPGGGLIQRKMQSESERVLAPKVRGTLVLDAALKDVELDFLVLCSSLASPLGGLGQVDYAGANAFLDIFAYYKTFTDGQFTTCISWDAWQEVGMAAESTRQLTPRPDISQPKSIGALQDKELLTSIVSAATVNPELKRKVTSTAKIGSSSSTLTTTGFASSPKNSALINDSSRNILQTGLLPAEGIKVFKRILGSKLTQTIVSTCDFFALVEKYKTDSSIVLQDAFDQTNIEVQINGSHGSHSRPELSNAYVLPRNKTEQTVSNIWQQLFGIEKVGIYDNFFELKGDSMLAIQFTFRVQQIFQLKLSVNSLLEAPTVASISEQIENLSSTAENNLSDKREEIEL